jgi:hypothetical protein
MGMSKHKDEASHSVAAAIGKGILAGLAGTAAITLSQMIEMKINDRKPSTAPADAASKVLDVKPATEQDKEKFSQEVHWAYGTTWGLARAVIGLTGLKGFAATAVHFTAIFGTALIMEPALDVAPPVKEWEPKTIAIDVVHHAVYAAVAGLVYDAIE